MKDQLLDYIKMKKTTKISLSELEAQVPGITPYNEFAVAIQQLEKQLILTPVKAQGENTKNPSLFYTYKINKHAWRQAFIENIKHARLHLHQEIFVEAYLSLPETQFEHDLPFLHKIHTYLKTYGFPAQPVPAPERSFQLVGDEKWIEEKNGQSLLKRVNLWEKLAILPVADPFAFAISPHAFSSNSFIYRHLIVENKTTYQALLTILPETSFATLIYGQGKAIIKAIDNAPYQLPFPSEKNVFYYFGDIDREGINIWHSLNQKQNVHLAIPFYQACLKMPFVMGKETQRMNEEAATAFYLNFSTSDAAAISYHLSNGYYLPQETLTSNQLQNIWRDALWT